MGLLSEQLALDSEAFVDTDGFGEAISYTPKGGVARTINAVVFRLPPEAVIGAPVGSTPILEIEVRNHATLGIVGSSIVLGGDIVRVPLKVGATATAADDRHIARKLSEDSGMLRLRLA